AGWIGSFTRYKGKAGGSDLPNWLEAHRAGTWIIDRKTGERRSLFIQHAAVSVCGGIQPGVFVRSMSEEVLESGLVARIVAAMQPRAKKEWTDAEPPQDVEDAYTNVIRKLLDLHFHRNDKGEEVPYILHLSPEAKRLWIHFYNEWAEKQASADGPLASAF